MTNATDFLGNTISAGDFIAYPNRQGSSMWMNKAQVVSVIPKGESFKLKVRRDDGLVRTLVCLDRILVITAILENSPSLAS